MTRLALRSKTHRRLAFLLAGSLVAAACGGTGGGAGDEPDDESREPGEADAEVGAPQRGGSLVYGLEGETANGFCMPEAQLAVSGVQLAKAVYDTLTVPNAEGEFVPHLAESIEPNDTFDEWTITLPEGVTFHDGTELTAEVVKNNLDAYRGAQGNHNRQSLLFTFTLADIDTVEVDGPLQLTVTTKRPWGTLPHILYSSGRLGIVAQSQLDAEGESCQRDLVGTGPFQLARPWQANQPTSLTRNENYWRTDENGEQLPYLDELEFRVIVEPQQRVNALQSGEINAFHVVEGSTIADMREQDDAGQLSLVESNDFADVFYMMPNLANPPFDNPLAREAFALAVDAQQINEIVAAGINEVANGPFSPGATGFVEDTGFPSEPDPERARELVQQYEQETGQPLRFRISTQATAVPIQISELTAGMLEDVGAEVTNIDPVDQPRLIDQVINNDFDVATFRLVALDSIDPDQHRIAWWSGGEQPGEGDPDGDGVVANPVNFPNINDPEIDRLFNEGREAADPAERQQIYEDLNRRLGEQHYLFWGTWLTWAVPSATDVHGVVGARPADGSGDFPGLASGHDPALLWREQ